MGELQEECAVTVSAIITTYNRRAFLREALKSVLSQDFRDMEVIVVDDGSDDGSYGEVTGREIRYLWQPNRGISSARNRGVALSRGRYVAFLDVDDLWMPRKISRQVAAIEGSGAAICYTDEIWMRNGRRVNQKKRHAKFSGHIFDRCLPLCIISPSSALIRREVFDGVGLFDETMAVCEDYDMWLRVTSRHPVLFLDEKLIVKQAGHGDQLSTRYTGMDRFRIDSLVRILKSGVLDRDQVSAVMGELRRKCRVYGQGAARRDRQDEAVYYEKLPDVLAALTGCSGSRSPQGVS